MDRIVRRKQLLELIGVSSTTQWRMEKAGQFPSRVKIGKGLVGWHLVEVEKWLEKRERILRRAAGCEMLPRTSDRAGKTELGISNRLSPTFGKNSPPELKDK